MTLTNQQVILALRAIAEIKALPGSPRFAYTLSIIKQKLLPIAAAYSDAVGKLGPDGVRCNVERLKLVSRFGERDKEGKLKEMGSVFVMADGDAMEAAYEALRRREPAGVKEFEEYSARVNALLPAEVEVTAPTLLVSEFPQGVTPWQMEALLPFVPAAPDAPAVLPALRVSGASRPKKRRKKGDK